MQEKIFGLWVILVYLQSCALLWTYKQQFREMKVGLARVSSVGQNLDSQIVALKEYGCEKIFTENKSGTTTL